MNTSITIANQLVNVDNTGRISLNDLHKISGENANKRPSNWLRLEATQEIIAELERCSDLSIGMLSVIKGGLNQGTYAHELLAISYAGWISPRFQLQVNQAFLDSKRPKTKTEHISISKDEYIDLLKNKIHQLEHRKKKHRRTNKPLSQQERANIVLLHRQGLTNRQIADKLNRSIATVWHLVR